MKHKLFRIFDLSSKITLVLFALIFLLQSFVMKEDADVVKNDTIPILNPKELIVEKAWQIMDDLRTQTPKSRFDCSGFVVTAYKKAGYIIPRSSADQYKEGLKILYDEAMPGDLLFFNTNNSGVSHVGIYLGDSTFMHAALSRGIKISKLNEKYWQKHFIGAADLFQKSHEN